MEYRFNYKSIEELDRDLKNFGLRWPFYKDMSIFQSKVVTDFITLPNRLAIHPMEGCDAKPDGSPSELTRRRYERYANGGAGLIWFEAVAVDESGRANNRQLFLHKKNVGEFADLINLIREKTRKKYTNFTPYTVLQLTHSGRFGENKKILFHDKILDKVSGIEENHAIISDQEIEALEDAYLQAAELAYKAGFDAVDIKSCHRYLLSEMLAAHTRAGNYGGSYENRTRFIKNVIKKIQRKINIHIAIRLNVYDSIPYPYGWGTDKQGEIDLNEPLKLVKELEGLAVKLINITASTSYLKPHINRPYNHGGSPPEHPLVGVNRLIYLSQVVQQAAKNSIVVGTGFSWLEQFAPYVAAGLIKEGWAKVIGFGRQAFAYPDFPHDIFSNNNFDPQKVCITCSKCAELKAAKKITGCVVRDSKVYFKPYQELQKNKKSQGGYDNAGT